MSALAVDREQDAGAGILLRRLWAALPALTLAGAIADAGLVAVAFAASALGPVALAPAALATAPLLGGVMVVAARAIAGAEPRLASAIPAVGVAARASWAALWPAAVGAELAIAGVVALGAGAPAVLLASVVVAGAATVLLLLGGVAALASRLGGAAVPTGWRSLVAGLHTVAVRPLGFVAAVAVVVGLGIAAAELSRGLLLLVPVPVAATLVLAARVRLTRTAH